MAIKLKNYTSTVPALTSIGHIESYLLEAGASDTSRSYDEDRTCRSIKFRIPVNKAPMFFQIDVNVEACFKVIRADRARPNDRTDIADMKQAEMTAWKIVSDWVEIQISMVLMKQLDLMQAFLSQAYNPTKNQTFYTQIKESNFKLLNQAK